MAQPVKIVITSLQLSLGLMILTGCATLTPPLEPTPGEPTAEMSSTRLMALWSGELQIDGNCVRLGTLTLAFPDEMQVTIQDDTLVLVDGADGSSATWREGQTIAMAGGEVGRNALSESALQDVLSRCGDGSESYWLVGDVGKEP